MGYLNSQYRTVQSARIEQRADRLHPVEIRRTAIKPDGKSTKTARLIELSVYGCRVSSKAVFVQGSPVWLRFEGSGPITATAMWCRSGEVGCRFDEKLDAALFRRLTLMRG